VTTPQPGGQLATLPTTSSTRPRQWSETLRLVALAAQVVDLFRESWLITAASSFAA
jgi:hypothetical protein